MIALSEGALLTLAKARAYETRQTLVSLQQLDSVPGYDRSTYRRQCAALQHIELQLERRMMEIIPAGVEAGNSTAQGHPMRRP